ncbi:TPA: hypothetical protein ACP7Q5_004827 [Escherichia coli]|jgi:hypothetical protein|uniref:Uncharacterized protein n=5 Tax=root TaxID=1 RepID=A0A8S5UI09_9CAUD|nr:hypothetical protein [Staphylococcus aureus]ELL1201036.1 hypothetical protein [Staphylococcus aureus]DAF94120.1 MAG TPA: hypothetical protein [Myoviridae sp. ctu2j3]DAF94291.1 MAG TPA: hypothetical protein [Myoviridae sp. ctu2j3]HBQ4546947.1 hypothetical protein [Escherichia coli]
MSNRIIDKLQVRVTSFYCSTRQSHAGYNKPFVNLGLYGRVSRVGVSTKFQFQIGNKKTRLDFTDATIFDGSDPRETALAVKQLLADWVRVSQEIPEAYRQRFVDVVLNHHKQ